MRLNMADSVPQRTKPDALLRIPEIPNELISCDKVRRFAIL